MCTIGGNFAYQYTSQVAGASGPAAQPTPGTLLANGERVAGTRTNADGTTTEITRPGPGSDVGTMALKPNERWHHLPNGQVQLIRGTQSSVQAGTLLADGSRQPGERRNADGTTTTISHPMVSGRRDHVATGANDRWHELPNGQVQLIQGSRPASTPAPGALLPNGERAVGTRTNADGTTTQIFAPSRPLGEDRLLPTDRWHHVGDGNVQLIRGSTPATAAGTLLANGSRQPGERRNADGTTTTIGHPLPADRRDSIVLGAKDRFHELPDGRIQLIRGSQPGR